MPDNSITELMGVVVPRAIARVQGTKLSEEGPILVTHWGMSGPGILKLSAWGRANWQPAITTSLPKSIGLANPMRTTPGLH